MCEERERVDKERERGIRRERDDKKKEKMFLLI